MNNIIKKINAFPLLIAVLSAIGTSTSCKEDYGGPDPFLSIPAGTLSASYDGLTSDGNTPSIEVGSNCDWSITDYPSWITPSMTAAKRGRYTVFFTCSENATGADRSGTIAISTQNIEKQIDIKQAFKVDALEVSADEFSVKGGSGLLDNGQIPSFYILETNSEWNITSDSDWLSATPSSGDPGEYIKIEITASENNDKGSRSGNLTISAGSLAKTISISQSKEGMAISVTSMAFNKYGDTENDAGPQTAVITSSKAWEAVAEDWITVDPSSGSEGSVTVTVTPSENTTGAKRSGNVTFNAIDGSNSTALTVAQSSTKYVDDDELFEDGFDWLQPLIDSYNAAQTDDSKKVGDAVAQDNPSAVAPNLYGSTFGTAFVDLLAQRRYEDLRYVQGSYECIYLQDCHLKMGKTNYHTGLRLPALDMEEGETANVVVSFDWCAHTTGSGSVDNVQIVVEVENAGNIGAGTKSEEFASTQQKGEYFWMNQKVTVTGVTKDSRITIHPSQMNLGANVQPNQQRWHIDNIRITRAK